MTIVNPQTSEWEYIKFKVQLITGSANVQIITINKHHHQFDQKYNSYLTMDAAIDATNLHQHEIARYQSRTISSTAFQNGFIEQDSKAGSIHRMLLFKLAVKRIMAVVYDGTQQLGFPENCDTLYLSTAHQQLNIFKHRFLVSSASQYSLCYDVQYKYTQQIEKFTNKQACEYCKSAAETYCQQDQQFYCKECFASNHRSQQKQSHQQQHINQFNSVEICQIHGDRKSMYCQNCRKILCIKCIKENHSKHQINQVTKMNDVEQKQKEFIEQLKNKVLSFIQQIQIKIQSLSQQLQFKQQQLIRDYTTQLHKLRQQYMLRNSQMVGLHSLLRNKYDEYVWIEQFVNYTSQSLRTDHNIAMKMAFKTYLQSTSPKQFYNKVTKLMQKNQMIFE